MRLLLPEGHSLNHTYRGNRPGLEGQAYTRFGMSSGRRDRNERAQPGLLAS